MRHLCQFLWYINKIIPKRREQGAVTSKANFFVSFLACCWPPIHRDSLTMNSS